MHGKGILTMADGTSYEGEYKEGRKHGMGKFKFTDEHEYIG